MINDLFDLFDKIIREIPDTIERDGQVYKVQLVPVKKDELVDNSELISEFNDEISKIDPEIWEVAVEIFAKKYNAKLFDDLMKKSLLDKEQTEQLKNAITAFHACVIDAANVRINYLTDRYINGNTQSSSEN